MRAANSSVMVNMEHDNIAFGLCAFPFVPIVDGSFLPASPQTLLNAGTFQGIFMTIKIFKIGKFSQHFESVITTI